MKTIDETGKKNTPDAFSGTSVFGNHRTGQPIDVNNRATASFMAGRKARGKRNY